MVYLLVKLLDFGGFINSSSRTRLLLFEEAEVRVYVLGNELAPLCACRQDAEVAVESTPFGEVVR